MKLKNNQSGIAHVAAILAVVVVVAIGIVGWKVWDSKENKANNETPAATTQPADKEVEEIKAKSVEYKVPEDWVQYQDKSKGVSFYYPADWEKSKFHVYKSSVLENIVGTNFGPYSAQYVFKKADAKWYAVDSDGNQIAPLSGYTTITKFPVSTYPAVYGYTGEGGGSSYYAVFTDGASSYMVELPRILEETDSTGLGEQKDAIVDLVKTIELND